MSDLGQRILEIIGQPQLSALATLTGDGKPWVRYVVTVGDDQMKIRFATFANSRKVKQIKANPDVHLTCGATKPTDTSPYLQVQGRAFFSREKKERHDFWNEMLKNYFHGPDDPVYGIVIIEPYLIEYCKLQALKPEIWRA